MESLLFSCTGNPLTAVLCGYKFERHASDLLQKGGKFNSYQLARGNAKITPADIVLIIPPYANSISVDKVLPNQTRNKLYVPITKNYTAIDACIPGIGAFQMTLDNKHDIKGKIRKDLALLGRDAKKFYWLLPPLYYDSFTKKTPQDIDPYAVLIHYR